ncbi:phosphotransferase [Marinactinospora thermotolerans]|nr:phosphotransferase [Marinactinospora thermotolerans]
MTFDEEPLSGGNVSAGVVRVGDTVRRPAGPWTPAVHALLDHLHSVGFHAAPRALGLDERGREVLSYCPGVPTWPERFDLMEPRSALTRVGHIIRDFHDAVAGFTPPPGARWRVLYPQAGDEIIAHHDLAPWNLIAGTDSWAFIDWDTAAPGTRLWDLAYAVVSFVPLSAEPALRRGDPVERMRALVEGYGLEDEDDRRRLIGLTAERARAMHDLLAEQAARGNAPWERLWREGHGRIWRANADHILDNRQRWEDGLLG